MGHTESTMPPFDIKFSFIEIIYCFISSCDQLLALICFSMDGIPESHILCLLGDLGQKTEAPPVVWSTLRRQLKPLIRMISVWRTGEPRIQFFHNTIQEVRLMMHAMYPGSGTNTCIATYLCLPGMVFHPRSHICMKISDLYFLEVRN